MHGVVVLTARTIYRRKKGRNSNRNTSPPLTQALTTTIINLMSVGGKLLLK